MYIITSGQVQVALEGKDGRAQVVGQRGAVRARRGLDPLPGPAAWTPPSYSCLRLADRAAHEAYALPLSVHAGWISPDLPLISPDLPLISLALEPARRVSVVVRRRASSSVPATRR